MVSVLITGFHVHVLSKEFELEIACTECRHPSKVICIEYRLSSEGICTEYRLYYLECWRGCRFAWFASVLVGRALQADTIALRVLEAEEAPLLDPVQALVHTSLVHEV